jgi:hypothetical protein
MVAVLVLNMDNQYSDILLIAFNKIRELNEKTIPGTGILHDTLFNQNRW